MKRMLLALSAVLLLAGTGLAVPPGHNGRRGPATSPPARNYRHRSFFTWLFRCWSGGERRHRWVSPAPNRGWNHGWRQRPRSEHRDGRGRGRQRGRPHNG